MTKQDLTIAEIREALANTLKQAIDTQAGEQLATPDDIRHGLIKALNERIEAYTNELVDLRKRELGHELKKNADMGYGAQTNMAPPAMDSTLKAELCKTCGKSHTGKACMEKAFDVEDDGKGFAKVKASKKKMEKVKKNGYGGVFKSVSKTEDVGFVKYEKSEKGLVIKEVYSPFAGKATNANMGAFDVVKDMIFGDTHPATAIFTAFGEQHIGSAMRIPDVQSVALNKGMNAASLPQDIYLVHESIPAMQGFKKSEGDWFGEFKKAEELIDLEHSGDQEKRYVRPGRTGVLPGDKAPKKFQPNRDGSGGDISKGKGLGKGALVPEQPAPAQSSNKTKEAESLKNAKPVQKAAVPMAKPPSGQVPGAKTPVSNPGGAATGAPKSSAIPKVPAPKLPGMGKISTEPGGGGMAPKPVAPKLPGMGMAMPKPAAPAIAKPTMKGEAAATKGKVYTTGQGKTTHANGGYIKAGGAQASHPKMGKEEVPAEKEVKSNPAKGADGKVFATGTGETQHVNADYIKAGGAQSDHPAPLAAARGASADRQDKIGKGEKSGTKVTAGASTAPKLPKNQDKGSGGQKSHPPIQPGKKV